MARIVSIPHCAQRIASGTCGESPSGSEQAVQRARASGIVSTETWDEKEKRHKRRRGPDLENPGLASSDPFRSRCDESLLGRGGRGGDRLLLVLLLVFLGRRGR